MSLAVLRPLAFGEVLDQAFGLFRRSFVPLIVISLACSGLPALLSIAVQARGGVVEAPILYLMAMVLSVLGGALASGASTFVVSEQYLGRELPAGDALARAWPRAWQIILTSMTVGILTGLGVLLLIVPGVIAFTGLSLAVTAVAVEGVKNDVARSRSWELTRGFRWRQLGLLIVYVIIAIIGFTALGVVTALLIGAKDVATLGEPGTVGTGPLVVGALSSLLMMAINPLMYCILVVSYYDLRVRKEAFDLDLLASTLEHSVVPAR